VPESSTYFHQDKCRALYRKRHSVKCGIYGEILWVTLDLYRLSNNFFSIQISSYLYIYIYISSFTCQDCDFRLSYFLLVVDSAIINPTCHQSYFIENLRGLNEHLLLKIKLLRQTKIQQYKELDKKI